MQAEQNLGIAESSFLWKKIRLPDLLCLGVFLLSLRIFAENRNSVGFAAVSTGLLVLLLLALVFQFLKNPVDWRLLLLGYLLPGFLVLGFQHAATYFLPLNDTGSLVFDPLGFVGSFSGYLFPKFILSVLFPLLVLVFNFRRVLRYNPLVLAWLAFLVSLPQMYLCWQRPAYAPSTATSYGVHR